MAFSSGRFFEEEDLPDDATVVERTWRFSRPDGSPDPRYKKDNVEIPVVLYGLLEISTPPYRRCASRSRTGSPQRFARTFGAEVSTEEPKEEKGRPRRRTPPGR